MGEGYRVGMIRTLIKSGTFSPSGEIVGPILHLRFPIFCKVYIKVPKRTKCLFNTRFLNYLFHDVPFYFLSRIRCFFSSYSLLVL